ncbi:MAG: toxic anion resistance protein, partial [Oscillospiraceae bacterium]|nr:toxic anion resistance protein [Oscillospiraceae bacterium]
MAINLRHPKRDDDTTNPVITAQPVATQITDIQPVQQYDIVQDQQQVIQAMDMQEIDQLTSQISIDDMDSIVSFGSESAEAVSKASDAVLSNMSFNQINESSEMLKALSRIMEQFDIDELKEPKGLQKLFNKAQAQIEKVLKKYNSMGSEIDKIYVELRKFQEEIKQSNRKLSTLFES